MYRTLIASLFLFVGTTSVSNANSADDTINSAYKVCEILDKSMPLSKPCKVSTWSSAVDISVDTNSSEARSMCVGIAGLAKQHGMYFSKGWKMRIYSPFSDGNTIAVCSLE